MAGNFTQSIYELMTSPSGGGIVNAPPPSPSLSAATYQAMSGPSGSMVQAPPAPAPVPTGGSYEDWAAENIGGGTLASPPEGAPMTLPQPELAGAPGEAAPEPAPRPQLEMINAGGSGVIPAHEASRLGPSQWAALAAGNEAAEGAVGQVVGNSQQQAATEQDMYLAHARDARMREDAANVAALEREEEMQRRAQDFDRAAKDLSQQRLDPDRFWASRSTPQKVASFISIALGGFLQGAKGGPNIGMEMINTAVDRDIKAQEFSYMAKRDTLEASKTAFGQAVQRYQSVDAARAFSRVAAMDAVSAEIQRQSAAWKGTEAANRGALALAEIAQARADQILKGIQFIPDQRVHVEARYRVPNRLGSYTAREVDALQDKEAERGFELEKIERKEAGEIRKEQVKAGADDTKYIAKALQAAGIPETRSAAEQARKALVASPKGTAERVSEYTPVGQSELTRKLVFGKEAADREQVWANFKNTSMKAMMGNVTGDDKKLNSEVQRATAALEGAHDTESRLNAIKFVQTVLDAQEENIRKGANEASNETYDGRQVRTGGPKPMTGIKSFKADQ